MEMCATAWGIKTVAVNRIAVLKFEYYSISSRECWFYGSVKEACCHVNMHAYRKVIPTKRSGRL